MRNTAWLGLLVIIVCHAPCARLAQGFLKGIPLKTVPSMVNMKGMPFDVP
jgi:hypothetical protein